MTLEEQLAEADRLAEDTAAQRDLVKVLLEEAERQRDEARANFTEQLQFAERCVAVLRSIASDVGVEARSPEVVRESVHSQVTALREALGRYGEHEQSCPAGWVGTVTSTPGGGLSPAPSRPCDCGLAEALRGVPVEAKEARARDEIKHSSWGPQDVDPNDMPELPVPRLEMLWERGSTSIQWYARYRLVYRHFLDHLVIVRLGETRVHGSETTPLDGHDGRLKLPFRDGCHIEHDALELNLPAYVIWEARIEKIEPSEHIRGIRRKRAEP